MAHWIVGFKSNILNFNLMGYNYIRLRNKDILDE